MLVCLKLVKEFLLVRMHNEMSLIVQFSLYIILVVQTKVPLLCLLCGSACIVCLHVQNCLGKDNGDVQLLIYKYKKIFSYS